MIKVKWNGRKNELRSRSMQIENEFQGDTSKVLKYQFNTLDCALEDNALLDCICKTLR